MKTVFFWLAIVFALSVYPVTRTVHIFEGADKVFHFIIYAITCALFYVELKKPLRLSMALLLVISVVLASAYGLLMEIAQGMLVASRKFSIYDALANALGAVFAAVAIAAATGRKE